MVVDPGQMMVMATQQQQVPQFANPGKQKTRLFMSSTAHNQS